MLPVRVSYVVMLALAPIVVVAYSRKLGERVLSALLVTLPVTWLGAALALEHAGPADPLPLFIFLVLVLPFLVTFVAGTLATVLVRGPRADFMPGLLGALTGTVAGLVLGYVVEPLVTWSWPTWYSALAVAPPAVYGACGAVAFAALGRGRELVE